MILGYQFVERGLPAKNGSNPDQWILSDTAFRMRS
jgi:hypothetical protein